MHRACICALVLAVAAGTARAADPAPVAVQVELDHGRARLVATWRWKVERGIQGWRFELPEEALVTAARFEAGGVVHELVLIDRTHAGKQLLAAQHRASRTRSGRWRSASPAWARTAPSPCRFERLPRRSRCSPASVRGRRERLVHSAWAEDAHQAELDGRLQLHSDGWMP